MTNPIETAVAPLKNDAMDAAEKFGREVIAKVEAELKTADFDIHKAAPYPNSWNTGRREYMKQLSKHNLFSRLTAYDESRNSGPRTRNAPEFVTMSAEGIAKFIKMVREDAAAQYESFVAKLKMKIGATESAVLDGNHVWSYSILRVVKSDGVRESWKTKTIINVSKLGKVFNQYPTRKVKA